MYRTDNSTAAGVHLSIKHILIAYSTSIHCVQKKTPTHIFFRISMSDV